MVLPLPNITATRSLRASDAFPAEEVAAPIRVGLSERIFATLPMPLRLEPDPADMRFMRSRLSFSNRRAPSRMPLSESSVIWPSPEKHLRDEMVPSVISSRRLMNSMHCRLRTRQEVAILAILRFVLRRCAWLTSSSRASATSSVYFETAACSDSSCISRSTFVGSESSCLVNFNDACSSISMAAFCAVTFANFSAFSCCSEMDSDAFLVWSK
mmetsp:Transcript_23291/g.65996  ORF Transcript_23291/g.65996 Transcript_23291/m.65996 type:complete len:213 (+) Transcript_23291:122-760(+)